MSRLKLIPHDPPSTDDDDAEPMSKVRSRAKRLDDDAVNALVLKLRNGEVQMADDEIARRVERGELSHEQGLNLVIASNLATAQRYLPPEKVEGLERLMRVHAATDPKLKGSSS